MSHNVEELRGIFSDVDTSHILILDDTSFSGTTSIILEKMLRQSLFDRNIRFAHGFLILNDGKLGNNPAAKQCLEQLGSQAVSGTLMHTPNDDGWHFFDIVEQDNFDTHIHAIMDLLHTPEQEQTFENLQQLFPTMLMRDELITAQKTGHFITNSQIDGELHVRNPQILLDVIKQGHLLPPQDWRDGEIVTLESLKIIHRLLKGDEHV